MSADALTLPADTRARLHIIPDQPATLFLVVLARPPLDAAPEDLAVAGGVSAVLAHPVGTIWPDRTGMDLAQATLAAGGAVGLLFVNLADALACKARLDREGGQ